MEQYLHLATGLSKEFFDFEIHYLPRDKNIEANSLVIDTTAFEDRGLCVSPDVLERPSIDPTPNICAIERESPCWMDPIETYISDGTLSSDQAEAQKVKCRLASYSIIDGTLYLPKCRQIIPSVPKHVRDKTPDGRNT
ncbi:hypothetical protein QJS04_geneDACA014230 [Acorus gramineus]|uniref:RNase H type-1 domain-containing protein n=1 Tax=Acorus gramineus TaxID=55184 RepID=A0AAV9BZ44_ACOGR|nr:hypothetical protein QJS04_geneDACA014230 [Acorus gramineus]